jgi:hypothetical protein
MDAPHWFALSREWVLCPPNSAGDAMSSSSPVMSRLSASSPGPALARLSYEPREAESLRRHTRTGRPLGGDSFVAHVERLKGRSLWPRNQNAERSAQRSPSHPKWGMRPSIPGWTA